MKNIFSGLLNSVFRPKSVCASAEIVEFMQLIKASEQSLVIGLEETPISFPSVVRALNYDHQVFVIECRQSITPVERLRSGMVFNVQAENNDCAFSFKAKYIEPLIDHNYDGYVLQFPKVITIESTPATYH